MNRRDLVSFLSLLPLTSGVLAKSVEHNEAVERRLRSHTKLQKLGIRVNEHLPVIETASEVSLRTKEEVVSRAFALTIVAEKGATKDHDLALRMVRKLNAETYLSQTEKVFVNNPSPSSHDCAQFSWRYEGFGVLLWALGFVEQIPVPAKVFSAPELAKILISLGPDAFRQKASMRSVSPIIDEADFAYRLHWAVRNASLTGETLPAGIYQGTAYERHYAFNWLIGYMNQDWDDVSTDT